MNEAERKALAIFVGIVILATAAGVLARCAQQSKRRAVAAEARATAAQTPTGGLAALEADLSAVKEERDSLRARLAPFEALAQEQFPEAPADQLLPSLLKRIKSVASGATRKGRRHLDAEAVTRIREKLEAAPALTVEVGCFWDDRESKALAEELRAVFTATGHQLRPLVHYAHPEEEIVGVAIYSTHNLDNLLGGAIAQIFAEIGQDPAQWLSQDLVGTTGPGEAPPDLKVIVGRQ